MTNPLPELIDQGMLPNVTQMYGALPASAHPDAIRATQELIERLEANHTPPATIPDEAWYSFIPLPIETFLQGMHTARLTLGPGRHRFLEVGAGIGTKTCLANALGYDAHGIELHQPYVDVAHRIFPHVTIDCANAQTYDNYGAFDLIYCYRVAVNRDLQDEINHRIANQMHDGAIFFSASGSGPYPDWDGVLEHIQGLVWRK